jgi:hypothetical protein
MPERVQPVRVLMQSAVEIQPSALITLVVLPDMVCVPPLVIWTAQLLAYVLTSMTMMLCVA